MKTIPVMIPIDDDELLYSWFYRLAKANGFSHIADFAAIYIYNNSKRKDVPYDMRELSLFAEQFESLESFINLYLQSSVYPFFCFTMTPENQSMYINQIFRKGFYDSSLSSVTNKLLKVLNICPQCMQEEIIAKGYYTYHRAHQLPGVKVCHKHKCMLHRFAGIKGHEMDNEMKTEILSASGTLDNEYRYAVFAYNLIQHNPEANINNIKNIIISELRKKGITSDKYSILQEKFDELGLTDIMYTKDVVNLFDIKICRRKFVNPIDIAVLLMYLFDSADNIPLSLDTDNKQHLNDMLISKNYTLISRYRENIIALRHSCGYQFITSPSAFSDGWECPVCDDKIEPNILFNRIITSISDDEYTPLESFAGWDTKIDIRHDVCGQIINIEPRRFYIESIRCLCNYTVLEDEVRTKIKECGDFELIEFKGASNPIKIMHKECGRSFLVSYYKFIRRPWCRECYTSNIRNRKDFEKEIKKITADTYTLIGKFHKGKDKKISLKHENCGRITEMYAWNFLNGQRCRYCTTQISHNDFINFVNNASGGLYKCTDNSMPHDSMMTIKNTESGISKKMYKSLVLQELTRPTPSRLLPLKSGTSKTTLPKSTAEKIYSALCHNYRDTDFIHLDDFRNRTDINSATLKANISRLADKELIVRVYPGIYTFTSNNNFEIADIIESKYIRRAERIIGYYYGPSFAYHLGIINEKPERMWICTLKEGQQHGRTYSMLGQRIRIKHPKCDDINERSILILPLLDRLSDSESLSANENECYYQYLKNNNISKEEAESYLYCYPPLVKKRLKKLYHKGDDEI